MMDGTEDRTIAEALRMSLVQLNAVIEVARDEHRYGVTLEITRGTGLGKLTIKPPGGGKITIEPGRRHEPRQA